MLTLKRSNLSSFITRERTLLTSLWDTLYLSPSQRLSSFPPYSINVDPILVYNSVTGVEEEVVNENVSEELLVAHEREREKVEGEVEEMRPVLERLGRYFGVVEEMRELEVSFWGFFAFADDPLPLFKDGSLTLPPSPSFSTPSLSAPPSPPLLAHSHTLRLSTVPHTARPPPPTPPVFSVNPPAAILVDC